MHIAVNRQNNCLVMSFVMSRENKSAQDITVKGACAGGDEGNRTMWNNI